ncbi:MAG: prolipoprotein diacylglyceryl transferase, partial [Treponemataceae bacterium]|nr:prolipoprotein diacylglyceryl transferase [Treponemataceae bacterium]
VDAMVTAIPLGYTFGRLGNFLNGELYGRIAAVPWGVVFPNAERFSVSLDWVRAAAEKAGMEIAAGAKLINLPRHPSQLYEALFEGVILWLILWVLRRHRKWEGMLSAVYMGGYGFFRFFIEYFREPDADIGYRIARDSSAPIYMNTSLLNFSTGQVFCFVMIVGAVLLGAGTYLYGRKRGRLVNDGVPAPKK